jgi:hypothetical protein
MRVGAVCPSRAVIAVKATPIVLAPGTAPDWESVGGDQTVLGFVEVRSAIHVPLRPHRARRIS